jgi:glycine/D-amino acid oxidase-like deaminating enzyme
VAVVGGGVFGASTALALAARGRRVTLLDPGPLPHPLAASTDISKVVRMEYGADSLYAGLADRAIDGWERWNADLERRGERPVYHACGVLFARLTPIGPGSFEADSERVLAARGHATERLSGAEIARRFPLLAGGSLVEGIFNRRGGFAEAERAMVDLVRQAEHAGVALRQGTEVAAIEGGERADGPVQLRTGDGQQLEAEQVVVTTGAWTRWLLPETDGQLQASAQAIFHLGTGQPGSTTATLASPPHLPVFGADLSSTGYYGFPAHPVSGVLKIGRHSSGCALHPGDPDRRVSDEEQQAFRGFLEEHLPAMAELPLVASRTCFYSDTRDGHFLIDRVPGRPAVVVATGDSGHAFKFAPVLGELIADLASHTAGHGETLTNPAAELARRFRWRPEGPDGTLVEAARHRPA